MKGVEIKLMHIINIVWHLRKIMWAYAYGLNNVKTVYTKSEFEGEAKIIRLVGKKNPL